MDYVMILLLLLVITGLLIALITVKTIGEHERAVIFRLGRLHGVRGPGRYFMVPGLERMLRVDLRPRTLDVPAIEVITRDNEPVRLGAQLEFQVEHPERALVVVADYLQATHQLTQTTLRSMAGEVDLSDMYNHPEHLNQQLQRRMATETAAWGINVTRAVIQHSKR